ncbi:MAG: pknH 2 [Planctomycetaceae bacterium]|nr:pknH 2 [Planctomycetaceae bacterium]
MADSNSDDLPSASAEELLAVRLAQLELDAGSSPRADNSTLQDVMAELDTLTGQLRKPTSPTPFESESACERAVDLVKNVGRDASVGTIQEARQEQDEPISPRRLGQYQILKKLGEGGMGAVYKAMHTRLQKVVAIKVLSTDWMKNQDAVARFEREMVAVGRLTHRNIIGAHDAGEIDGTHFLVMEYVQGLDLSKIVQRLGALSVADACEVVRQAAVGLQYAHSHGMVHRDIKPSNLMLLISEEQGQRQGGEVLAQAGQQLSSVQQPVAVVKILDMGLALLAGQHAPNQKGLTSTGQMMGTIDYMAPEQGNDTHHVDIRADIFSLGATLFQLLTGDVPLTDAEYSTPMKKLWALATATLPSISTRRSDLPPALVAIVDRMLSRDPAARYAIPGDVAQVLAPFARDHRLAAVLAAAAGDVSVTDIDRISLGESRSGSYSLETSATLIGASPAIVAGGEHRGPGASIDERPFPSLVLSPRRKPPGGLSLGWLLAMAGGAAAAALMGVVFFFFNGGDGVRIEIPDDAAFTVQFDKNGILISGPHPAPIRVTSTQAANGEATTIGPGSHKLVIRRGDLEFETKEFVLKENGRTTLKIEAIAGNVVQLTKDGVVYDQGSLNTPKVAATAAAPMAVAIAPSKPPKTARIDAASPQPAATDLWKPGPLLNNFTGLVHRPASLPGIKRWQIDTAVPTTGLGSVSWSPDGRRFICITGKRPRIYDGQTLQLVGTLPAAGQDVNIVAWNPVEDWIAAASDRIIRFWKSDGTPGPILEGHPHPVASLVWNSAGTRLASSTPDGTIRVWGADGRKLHEFHAVESNQPILAWGPDGQIAYQVRFSDRLHIVTEDGMPKRTHVLDPGTQCSNLIWHRDGRLAAQSYSNGTLFTWNADGTDGPKIESGAWHVNWTNDGDRILLGRLGLKVWDRATGKIDTLLEMAEPLGISLSPDGQSVCCWTQSGAIQIRNLAGKLLREINPLPSQPYVAWNPAGTILAGVESNGTLRMWKPTGQPLESIPVSPGRALAVKWSPDGEYIAWAMEHGSQSVHILSLSQADRTPMLTINGGGGPLAFSPDCKFIFLGGAKEIRRLDGTFSAQIPANLSALTAAWSSKGQLAAGSAHEFKCQFFEPNGSLSLAIESPEKSCCPITEMAWNRSGTLLAAANFAYRKTVIIDSKGKVGPVLQTHHEYVNHVDWSPDEQQLVTGGDSPTVRITGLDGTRGPAYEKGGCKSVSWGDGPNRGRIAISLGAVAEVWNADLSEMLWVVVPFPGGKSATFSGAGQLTHGDKALIEDHLLYFVERTGGRIDVLRPAAFRDQILKEDHN